MTKMTKMTKQRKGVAQAIMVFLLLIILTAAIYIPLNFAVQSYESIQQSLWPASSGVFDTDALLFVEQYWLWLPAILFFIFISYVYLKAEKRDYTD